MPQKRASLASCVDCQREWHTKWGRKSREVGGGVRRIDKWFHHPHFEIDSCDRISSGRSALLWERANCTEAIGTPFHEIVYLG